MTINGHTLTDAERRAVRHLQHWLWTFGGDSNTEPNRSPVGDGRWVPLLEIFPRWPAGNTLRQAIRRLHNKGVLMACEIAYYGDCVQAVPAERVAALDAAWEAWSEPTDDEVAAMLAAAGYDAPVF